MRLEEIGFYTLSDQRAFTATTNSRMMRGEILLGSACNLKCKYCRGIGGPFAKPRDILETLDLWVQDNIFAVRFSGGEPTLHPGLATFIAYCNNRKVEHIAISTNGTASKDTYSKLLALGLNDVSVSLDACCAASGDKMAGISGAWKKATDTIAFLAGKCYVTVGIVLTKDNLNEVEETIKLATNLGASDIRVIPAAQYMSSISINCETKMPILKYRLERAKKNLPVRGLSDSDTHHCWLVLDDMAVIQGYHYPCIIYAREGGKPIGRVSTQTRYERARWANEHDTHLDPICSKQCLDVCVTYNNKANQCR